MGESVDVDSLPWGRQPFLAVNEAHRWSYQQAAAGNPTPRQWRVFGAVVSLTAGWCKLVDSKPLAYIAETASASRSDPWRIGVDLKALSDMGAVVYVPGVGHQPSVIGLARPETPQGVGVSDTPVIPLGHPSFPIRTPQGVGVHNKGAASPHKKKAWERGASAGARPSGGAATAPTPTPDDDYGETITPWNRERQ